MIKERRKHSRSKKKLPLKIQDKSFDIITETVDISPSGMYCRITRYIPVMSKIEIMLLLPSKKGSKGSKKIKCGGVVVRIEPVILEDTEKAHYNAAIFFNDLTEKDEKTIEEYVASSSEYENEDYEVHIKK